MGTESGCDTHVLVADVVVMDDSAVLLVRRSPASDDAAGWGLPGDALRFGEAPDACARRVLNEGLGLAPEWITLAEVESAVEGGVWSLVFHFRCDADRPPAPGSAIAEARFFQIEHLPPTAHGAWERDVIYRVMTGAG